MAIFITIVFGSVALFLLLKYIWTQQTASETSLYESDWIKPQSAIAPAWKKILLEKVVFYNALSSEEQKHFEYRIQEFLLNHKVTGVKVDINTTDKVLVAASAIIPVFGIEHWRYHHLDEVLLYPQRFNHDFETSGDDRSILGMVGTGFMEGTMILSKPALHLGFSNESDKKNTAIHEFIHLIDKQDGEIDGVPDVLLTKQYTLPWLDLINQKIDLIYENKTDINPYGRTNRAEFFAVTSEYFFERPKLMEHKHPDLYRLLEEIYKHDMAERNMKKRRLEIGRNSPCPCDSGKKFKKCCGV
jgi:Mlc titration factor MtfA (ptsG expression regulator)